MAKNKNTQPSTGAGKNDKKADPKKKPDTKDRKDPKEKDLTQPDPESTPSTPMEVVEPSSSSKDPITLTYLAQKEKEKEKEKKRRTTDILGSGETFNPKAPATTMEQPAETTGKKSEEDKKTEDAADTAEALSALEALQEQAEAYAETKKSCRPTKCKLKC